MVVGQKLVLGRLMLALAVPVGSLLLAGCGAESGTSSAKDPQAKQVSDKSGSADTKVADEAVMQQLAQENAPRTVSFKNPGMSDLGAYLDAKQPMTTFNLYNSKRDWDESGEDIAESLADPFKIREASPELYRLASERQSTQDSFKKKELATALSALVAEEAGKANPHNLVKLSSDQWTPISLGSYDQQAKGFRIDNCLFSDKLEYTDAEKRNATTMDAAPKLRCYLNPGPTTYFIGFQGGSEVLLDVPDQALAREIEAHRDTIRMDIYGFVKSVERERFAGEFGPQRFVLIAPQRIDLKDGTTGKIIYTKNI